ncbi:hypothetical protein ACFW88_00385 [Streptomyces anandii]|uniref:Minor tail protein n=1 Tax=Streptomyces anandii TaxID=285454 RepID=A0ABW6GXA5_9ACTN
MAFPQTPLDVRIELFIGGVWVDVTADVYTAEKINITRGRADEGARTDPGKCTLTFNNRLGKYSPRNPLSPYYGLIGRNTPLRVSVPGPTSYLDLDGQVANYASTPDTAVLDITGDLDIRWEGEADWYATGAQMLIGKWVSTTNNRSYVLRLEAGTALLVASTDGTAANSYAAQWPLPGLLPRRLALRATLDVDNGAGGSTLRLYWAPSISGPWTQISVDAVFPGGPRTVYAGTAPLSIAPSQTESVPPRLPVTGKTYRAEVRNGIDGTVVANPDFTAQTPGTSSFNDAAGRTWTLAGTAAITNRRMRFVGEVSSWPSRWDVSGKDVRVPVEAAGILRRIGQGAKALDSTLRRRIPSGGPLVYWPLEDGSTATRASSAISGGQPLTVSGLTFASDDSLAGSSSLPVLGASASLTGRVPNARAGAWHAEMVYKLGTMPAVERTVLSLNLAAGTGGVAQVLARVSTAGIRVQALDGNDNVVAFVLFSNPDSIAAFTGVWNRLQIFSAFDGTQTYVNVGWRNVVTNIWWYARTAFTGTPGTVTAVRGSWDSNLQGMAIGHLAVFDVGGTTAPAPGVTIYEGADDGFSGETAGTRMTRLATEEALPVTVYGSKTEEERVGPQRPDTVLALLEEAADVDGGILYEQRDRIGLVYRDRISLYNQTPALELDYTQPGHIAPPLEPIDDDQQVRNDRTVQRNNGASARAVLDSGPLSVQAPPGGVGVYDDSATLNLYSDAQAEPQAYWRLCLGTVDEARYPVVNLDLAAAPSLVDQVTALDSGDRIRIANPPAWLPPGPIDLIVQGYQETIGHPNDWDFQLNCTPASPWTVSETAIVEDFEDTDYAVTITSGGNLPWARSQLHYNTGTWSLRSGAITNNQTSDALVTVPSGSTELTFWYWVSSENSGPGFEGDRLLVLVDGVQVLRAQGSVGWTSTTVNVTGAGTVTFRYIKDNSSASGEDAAHIDDLTFTRRAPMRADTDGSQLAAAATSSATSLTVATTTGLPWVTSAVYPDEFPFDIAASGERMRVTGITSAVSDAFGRTTASGWGTADVGGAWTTAGGSGSDYSTNGSAGNHSLTSINISRHTVIPAPAADVDIVVSASTSVLATGGPHYVGLLARYVDANNHYYARLAFNSDQTLTLVLQKKIGGVQTDMTSVTVPGTHAANTQFKIRLQVSGSTLSARAWRASGTEPTVWQATATDSTLTATGSVGVRSILSSANTNTLPVTAAYDDFAVLNPQRFTVIRSRNSITKAQTAGTDVRLADPAIVAL